MVSVSRKSNLDLPIRSPASYLYVAAEGHYKNHTTFVVKWNGECCRFEAHMMMEGILSLRKGRYESVWTNCF